MTMELSDELKEVLEIEYGKDLSDKLASDTTKFVGFYKVLQSLEGIDEYLAGASAGFIYGFVYMNKFILHKDKRDHEGKMSAIMSEMVIEMSRKHRYSPSRDFILGMSHGAIYGAEVAIEGEGKRGFPYLFDLIRKNNVPQNIFLRFYTDILVGGMSSLTGGFIPDGTGPMPYAA